MIWETPCCSLNEKNPLFLTNVAHSFRRNEMIFHYFLSASNLTAKKEKLTFTNNLYLKK